MGRGTTIGERGGGGRGGGGTSISRICLTSWVLNMEPEIHASAPPGIVGGLDLSEVLRITEYQRPLGQGNRDVRDGSSGGKQRDKTEYRDIRNTQRRRYLRQIRVS